MTIVNKDLTATSSTIPWDEISFPSTPILTTQRLHIRALHIKDAPRIQKLGNDVNIAKWLTNRFPHPYTLSDAESFVNRFGGPPKDGEPYIQFGITLRETPEEIMGCMGIHPGDDVYCRDGEIGYWFGSPYHGKGYATEAAKAIMDYGFALKRGLRGIEGETLLHLSIITYGGNAASTRIPQKLGFTLEGVSKDAVYKMGEVQDLVRYGKTRKDWLKDQE
jgi:[ribosomal protein S5]-alanine N-acetyltransferase